MGYFEKLAQDQARAQALIAGGATLNEGGTGATAFDNNNDGETDKDWWVALLPGGWLAQQATGNVTRKNGHGRGRWPTEFRCAATTRRPAPYPAENLKLEWPHADRS